jgi:hypothetical protein
VREIEFTGAVFFGDFFFSEILYGETMPIQNVANLKALLAQGSPLGDTDVNDALKLLITELETARRKISDLDSRVRTVEMRRP